MNINKTIGKNIKKAREAVGVSQKMLSELLNFKSTTAVSLIESGQRKISVENLYKTGIALGKPMEWFISTGSVINCGVCKDTNSILCNGEYMNCVFCNDLSGCCNAHIENGFCRDCKEHA
jgi:DNA-binding XRE family transcriptional regulator